jgi:hypothetical protein
MDTIEIVVIADEVSRDAYLVERPHLMPKSIEPFRVCGYFRVRDGKASVECAPGLENLKVMAESVEPFLQLLSANIKAVIETQELRRMVGLMDPR